VSSSATSDSSRGVIRQATHDIHERLHDHQSFRQLQNQTITRDEYGLLLARLYGFHQPLEAALAVQAVGHSGLQIDERCRVHLLIEDLRELGWSSAADLPLADAPADLDVPSRLLGCLYVREGAMLGGRVLANKLDHLLGPSKAGRLYFSGRENDMALWRACCAAIDRNNEKTELNSMISAAHETFEIFEQWMTRASPLTKVG
jgi:heme oxygenase (biliverdin-IX-beta and delta-forming)